MAYGFSSFACVTLWFGGSFLDGAIGFMYGVWLFVMSIIFSRLQGVSHIENFLSSFLISIVASAVQKYMLYDFNTCLYSQIWGGIVWLLPGYTIAISCLEIYSQMTIYGGARLIYGISLCAQLGFGIAIGYYLVYKGDISTHAFVCDYPVAAIHGLYLLPIASSAFAILVNAELSYLPGILLCSGSGQLTTYLLVHSDCSSIAGAIVVTLTARIYAALTHQRPMIFIINGLFVLVAGGLGVKGSTQLYAGMKVTCD